MEYTSCLICGSDAANPRFTLTDRLLGLPGTFYLVECRRCGLLYQNPRPTRDEIGAYYPPHYDLYTTPPWALPNPLTRATQLYGIKKRWAMVERWVPQRPARRLLDIGCSTGVFLAAAPRGWQVEGIEPSAAAAERAHRTFGLHVHVGMLEATELPPHTFDAVTLWDVLEHVHDPLDTLARIRTLLRPDGVLIFRVPNRDAADARLFGPCWAGLEPPRHLFVPGHKAISDLLAHSGYTELERICLSGSYGVFVLNCRFWLHDHVQGTAGRIALALINNLVARLILTPPLWLLDRYGKGPLLAVAARPVEEVV